ncbi:MAG: hypothetical protein L6Q67_16360 [Zoogloea sp.]|nr:hypothetical protein [Zoogloea sp.]
MIKVALIPRGEAGQMSRLHPLSIRGGSSITPPELIDESPNDPCFVTANLAVINTFRADRGKSQYTRIPSQPLDQGGAGLLPR